MNIQDNISFNKTKRICPNELKRALNYCIAQIDKYIDHFEGKFPEAASVNLIYPAVENDHEWTQGFYTGMLWIAYEVTKSDKYRKAAEKHVESFLYRIEHKIGVNHHDMGFLYTLSCVSAYKITGSEQGKRAALLAAEHLISRYQKKGDFIQAWGELGTQESYRLIIDCLLNLPLLYWATEVTGNPVYQDIAKKHFDTAVKLVIREDYSTHHTYYFDLETGKPTYGMTAQGFSNDSAWARGQAWAIYGLPLTYRLYPEESIRDSYEKVTDYFLNHLPEDFIPCWDLIFNDSTTQRDSSSAPIAICGILEMLKYCNAKENIYKNAIHLMMASLIKDYTTKGLNSNGILTHGVYSIPHGGGIDECTIWGDYFYMEALMRMIDEEWNAYW